jgi:hypothetical protein
MLLCRYCKLFCCTALGLRLERARAVTRLRLSNPITLVEDVFCRDGEDQGFQVEWSRLTSGAISIRESSVNVVNAFLMLLH